MVYVCVDWTMLSPMDREVGDGSVSASAAVSNSVPMGWVGVNIVN